MPMQIFVRGVDGASQVRCVDEKATVGELLATLDVVEKEQENNFHLSYGGKDIPEDAFVGEVLQEECTVDVNVDLLGAGKKRKKKQYTKPKKIKHKHKKVKLAVLKYYKVDANNKVTRLRKESPICGAGVFMAMHHNRYHCGKSGLTFMFNKEDEK
ncbi:unnamed protein product [Amoebophrya sp. A120]|nr:unnamed protein product [Amoebophrya sp. A120]|eukprot:GSA120T00015556001.1